LLAIIEDKGGINTIGSGIGHDLTGFLDNDPNRSFVLNNYFENDFENDIFINQMSGQDSLDNIKLIKFKFDDINVRDIRISSLNNLFVFPKLFK
jgi:hypothetical protein